MIESARRQRVPGALFALSGAWFIARSLMDLGNPTYYDPVTLFDYAAVIATTVALLALAAAIASLALRQVLNGAPRKIAWIPVTGLVISALPGNLFPDAFGMSSLGFTYGVGNILTLLGMGALAVSVLRDRRNAKHIGFMLALMTLSNFLPATLATASIGLLCLVMSYVLWTHRGQENQASER